MFISIFLTGCSSIIGTNPYERQLNIYKIQIAQGRDKAMRDALKASQKERLDIEKQYQKKILEYNMLLTAFARTTGKTVNEVQEENVLSQGYVMGELSQKEKEYNDRIEQIEKVYDDFFVQMDKQDEKIATIDETIKKVQDERTQTYYDITKSFIASLVTLGFTYSQFAK
jgi:hypothetical protein